jgi:hypothetical protein
MEFHEFYQYPVVSKPCTLKDTNYLFGSPELMSCPIISEEGK